MSVDWLFTADGITCGLRAAGVLLRDGRILMQRERSGTEYALPGGHVRAGETFSEALVREFREEMGADVQCGRLLWTEESFWQWNGGLHHTVTFYFAVSAVREGVIPSGGDFVPQLDQDGVLLGWVPLDELGRRTVYPSFLPAEISRLEETPKHFVTRD